MFELIVIVAVGYVIWKLKNSKPNSSSPWNSKESHISSQQKSKESPKFTLEVVEPKPRQIAHNKQTHLATENERKMYFALQKALPSEYVIHSQVSLMALVTPVDFKDNSKTWAKRMDFVITDKSTRILAVIELDDSTHNRKKRQERDKYVNEVLEGHHPLVRFNTERFYEPSYLARVLESKTEIRCNKFDAISA
ncbi:DUF2726 domain-containing protein [Vibrio parahaemolyticus]|nr:DUF2726 domain-containing protein [Vibrio parahaemolyticus]